jgi:hypothetical protein
MGGGGPRIVEWYRADPWPRMRRFVLIGPALLTLGSLVVAVSFLTHQPADVRTAATMVGFALVASAALVTTIGMSRMLRDRDDAYVALRTDGVVLRTNGRETLVPWHELAAARWDAARAELVLERDGADEVRTACRFARVSGRELAERIARTKLRAAMNLLR